MEPMHRFPQRNTKGKTEINDWKLLLRLLDFDGFQGHGSRYPTVTKVSDCAQRVSSNAPGTGQARFPLQFYSLSFCTENSAKHEKKC
ncbi:hypothetical protein CRE_01856 [Caenorhabditis remanei]|uniref:Uncharacterized protein n=1 Tax=Caenorhabditis remanei TaxID=31234 RepID=E3LFV8_CAERE|nr:hypothetical protein CRE_01856 [Caenorhabditis remanei]